MHFLLFQEGNVSNVKHLILFCIEGTSICCVLVCVCVDAFLCISSYLILAGKPSVAEVQALVCFLQGTELALQPSPLQLGGVQLCPQHRALSQQLRLRRQPLLLVGLQPATSTRTATVMRSRKVLCVIVYSVIEDHCVIIQHKESTQSQTTTNRYYLGQNV